MAIIPPKPPRGRGALSNPDNRYSTSSSTLEDDGWGLLDALSEEPGPATTLGIDTARSVISYNQSPDVDFDRSVNPYRGCEHGCVYCFARPTHAYLGLSPGLDFETRLFHKPEAPMLLRKELSNPGYRCQPLALGINTDGWQPVERRTRLTRRLLEVLEEFGHPVSIVTKSALIERDLDILARMAQRNLVQVMLSITTLDDELCRRMEPRAARPQRRLATITHLHEAGVPVGVLVAPVIPALTDHELEAILERSRAAGAKSADYVLLRLPHELKALFEEWLQTHTPLRARHVWSRLREMRDGKTYRATFGERMVGSGPWAELLRKRFDIAYRRLGFGHLEPLDTSQFRVPDTLAQMGLFD
ncbi:MAG: PA0069 family radical SAM protein [Halothiobacillaceae bacterium]